MRRMYVRALSEPIWDCKYHVVFCRSKIESFAYGKVASSCFRHSAIGLARPGTWVPCWPFSPRKCPTRPDDGAPAEPKRTIHIIMSANPLNRTFCSEFSPPHSYYMFGLHRNTRTKFPPAADISKRKSHGAP